MAGVGAPRDGSENWAPLQPRAVAYYRRIPKVVAPRDHGGCRTRARVSIVETGQRARDGFERLPFAAHTQPPREHRRHRQERRAEQVADQEPVAGYGLDTHAAETDRKGAG